MEINEALRYPSIEDMQIEVSNATAFCHNCGKQVATGTLVISPPDWMYVSGKSAIATGELLCACQEHHNRMRKWGQEDSPKHDTFTIIKANRVIGILTAPTMVSEVGMMIVNSEIQGQLREEAWEFRRKWGVNY